MCVLCDGLFSEDFWKSEDWMDGQFIFGMGVHGAIGLQFCIFFIFYSRIFVKN